MRPDVADSPYDAVVARLRDAGCVFAEDEARLLLTEASTPSELAGLVTRRVGGEPLEQVLGWAEFCELRICLAPGVFVPRRRTEVLAREAIALTPAGGTVVDLCCGTGAIGAAVASAVVGVELHAADIDPVAVACARRNLPLASVYQGDLFAALPQTLRGRIDVLVANVPYVPTDSLALMPPEARLHEPRVALDGGRDGLDVARRLMSEVSGWLAPGGSVLFETSSAQAPVAIAAAEQHLHARVVIDDEAGATVVIATAP